MREVSDQLCREAKISVIDHPGGRGKNYGHWQAEKNGQPTRRDTIRHDIDRAILASTTERGFVQVMTRMGYEFKTHSDGGVPLKYPALKPPGAKGFFRFHKLGEGYSLEKVKARIYQNVRKQNPLPLPARPGRHYTVRGSYAAMPKATGLQAWYFHYCYVLRIIVKRPSSVGRVSYLMREDVIKLDRYAQQSRLLAKNHITTGEQLKNYKITVGAKADALSARRKELRNQLRRVTRSGDIPAAEPLRAQIARLSADLKTLRREMVLCDDIVTRSAQVKANLEHWNQEKFNQRKEQSNELRQRSRRSDIKTLD